MRRFFTTRDIEKARRYAAGSEVDFNSICRWSILGAMLQNSAAKAAYVIPIAGYVILFSDFFTNLFRFDTHLPNHGFLTAWQRLNMAYFGSLLLLGAYGVYLFRSPALLRFKHSGQQFIADMMTARDQSALFYIARQTKTYIEIFKLDPGLSDDTRLIGIGGRVNEWLRHDVVENTEFFFNVPMVIRFFYNWQNEAHPAARFLIFGIAVAGYGLLLVPALDLFWRVINATIINRVV